MQLKSKFDEFISDPKRRRIYEEESLAFEASELISDLMDRESVNKVKLAAQVGTSKPHITSLLSGSRNMTLHTLADLTFALHHKIELKAVPLDATVHWVDADAVYDCVGSDSDAYSNFPEDASCEGVPPEDYVGLVA